MDQCKVIVSNTKLELAHCFYEWSRLNVSDSAAKLQQSQYHDGQYCLLILPPRYRYQVPLPIHPQVLSKHAVSNLESRSLRAARSNHKGLRAVRHVIIAIDVPAPFFQGTPLSAIHNNKLQSQV
jgi:hypothetical protein